MTIEEEVYSLLSAGLTSVTADRIKPPGDWQNLARPYVVHLPVTADIQQMHSGQIPLRRWPFYQVSVFADSYSSARSVADQVISTLAGVHSDGVTFLWRNMTPIYDDEVRVVQISVDFEVFEAL